MITVTLREEQCSLMIISLSVLLRVRNVSDIFVGKMKTH